MSIVISRDVLARIANGNQAVIRFFENLQAFSAESVISAQQTADAALFSAENATGAAQRAQATADSITGPQFVADILPFLPRQEMQTPPDDAQLILAGQTFGGR